MPTDSTPVVCTLTTAEAASQTLEWADLQSRSRATIAVPDGVEMRFGLDLRTHIEDLAAREAACCAFLRISLTAEDDDLVLKVTSPNPDAKPVISMLSGIPIQ